MAESTRSLRDEIRKMNQPLPEVCWWVACLNSAPEMNVPKDEERKTKSTSTTNQPRLGDNAEVEAMDDFEDKTHNILERLKENFGSSTVDPTPLRTIGNTSMVADEVTGVQGFFLSRFTALPNSILKAFDEAQGTNQKPSLEPWMALVESERKKLRRDAPDACLLVRAGQQAVLLFEMKTPWMHPLEAFRKMASGNADVMDESEARKLLGQLVDYLLRMNLRYGCLSTYEESVFVKLVEHNGTIKTLTSPVVRWNQNNRPDRSPIKEAGVSKHTLYEAMIAWSAKCAFDSDENYVLVNGESYRESILINLN